MVVVMSPSAASNPAGVRMDPVHFLTTDAKDLIILVGSLLAGGALVLFSWKLALIIAGLGVAVVVISVSTAKGAFQEGDVCAAIVLDPDRELVAVLADFSQGGVPIPVVKILKQPLRRAVGPTKPGTRLAFCALYSGRPGAQKWTNVGGYLVNTGTRDVHAIERVVSSISQDEWDFLISAVQQLETPCAPGLYDFSGRQ